MPQISLNNLSKTFIIREKLKGKHTGIKSLIKRNKREVHAIKNLTFGINAGELVGYIGPNGAGKSTTVKIMSGILTPDSGSCTIMGRVPWKDRISHVAQIGVVFGQRSQLWWDVAVDDSFDLLKDIYRIDESKYKKRLKQLTETLDIGPYLKTPVRQLSLGQRMRCEIAASVLHEPSILFLDEPTIGLDAVSKLALRQFLLEENKQRGVTMILTTHDMHDIEALCSRVMVIGKGELLYDGKLKELKRRYTGTRCIHVSLDNEISHIRLPFDIEIEKTHEGYNFFFDPEKVNTQKLMSAAAEMLPVNDIYVKEKNIDEIIADMYREMSI